jgi:hypothetical protein
MFNVYTRDDVHSQYRNMLLSLIVHHAFILYRNRQPNSNDNNTEHSSNCVPCFGLSWLIGHREMSCSNSHKRSELLLVESCISSNAKSTAIGRGRRRARRMILGNAMDTFKNLIPHAREEVQILPGSVRTVPVYYLVSFFRACRHSQ